MEPTQATGANEPHYESSIDLSTDSYTPHTGTSGRDALYEALSNSRRRQVIRLLADGPQDIGELARTIAAIENDIAVDAVDCQQRKRVYVSLYQAHLTKLDDWEIADWDETAQVIKPGPTHQPALEALQAVADTKTESLLDRVAARILGVVA